MEKYVFIAAPLWLILRRGRMEETRVTVILTILCVLLGVLGCLFDCSKLWHGVFS